VREPFQPAQHVELSQPNLLLIHTGIFLELAAHLGLLGREEKHQIIGRHAATHRLCNLLLYIVNLQGGVLRLLAMHALLDLSLEMSTSHAPHRSSAAHRVGAITIHGDLMIFIA
jgi:hypothetical protein